MSEVYYKSLDMVQVARSFNAAATSYDQYAVLQQEVARRLIARLDFIKIKPQCIIDIGAGTGYPTHLLAKRYENADIILLDVAVNMLKEAKKTFGKQKLVCAAADKIPLPDRSVDFIFSNLMLQWSDDLAGTLIEWARILKPDGLLLFTSFGPQTLIELRSSWLDVDSFAHMSDFHDFPVWSSLMQQAGFTAPVLDNDLFKLLYNDTNCLMRELKGLGANNTHSARNKALTGKKHWQQMLKNYDTFRDTSDKIPATFEVIYGHAWGRAIQASNEVSIPISKILRNNGVRS
ncbi:MAG: malonyl-ACP O-methyltransferase BioC [Gammaproteobacteria bacterium]